MTYTFEDIVSKIRTDILMDRLELGDVGVTLDSITSESILMDESGLGLDSVDALDILVGVQQIFGFKIDAIDRTFIGEKCRTVRSLAEYVGSRLQPLVYS